MSLPTSGPFIKDATDGVWNRRRNNEDVGVRDFEGVSLDDLHRVEKMLKTKICAYALVETDDGKTTAELVRRPLCHYSETLNVNLYETHFSHIQDVSVSKVRRLFMEMLLR